MPRGGLRWLLLLGCLCALALCSSGTSPGFVGRITAPGLDYARQVAVAGLREKLARLVLPDFSGSLHVRVFGQVDYHFGRLTIQSFQLPNSAVAPVPGVGLRLTITNAFTSLTGKWKVRKRWLRDSGSFDLKVERISISVTLRLGSGPAGRPTVSTSNCSASISDVDMHISGRFGWLYNLFHRSIESAFREAMEGRVCDEVRSSVSTKLQPFLHTLPVTANIDKVAGIDYSLVGPPVATDSSVDLALKVR
ncbi:Lipopolysaccharide-binding protein [Varanus komodoensis]|nr:Lipopolysaccharide-binding protein [Varanus komodoensis]